MTACILETYPPQSVRFNKLLKLNSNIFVIPMPLSFIIHTHSTHNYEYRIDGVELPSQLRNFGDESAAEANFKGLICEKPT